MVRKRALVMVGIRITVGAVGIAAVRLWPTSPTASIVLQPNERDVVAVGKAVYAAQCASCHGANLEGEPNWRERGPDGRLSAPPHDETGHTWHHPDEMLFELTKYGLPKQIGNGEPYYSNMPAYEAMLSDEEIVAVLSYIKSRWPDDIQARHDELNARMAAQQ